MRDACRFARSDLLLLPSVPSEPTISSAELLKLLKLRCRRRVLPGKSVVRSIGFWVLQPGWPDESY